MNHSRPLRSRAAMVLVLVKAMKKLLCRPPASTHGQPTATPTKTVTEWRLFAMPR